MVTFYSYITKILTRTKPRYWDINPADIRVGDIVELRLGFVGIPIRNERFKAMIALRGIIRLDDSFRNVSTNITSDVSSFT